ncbi:MAG TPA: 2Fe-2S iron-sulfur cluster-binding protein [Roseiarcus sp.]|nr:2Fe-2S iron-sulfur cluster-binding protein [Roseiarcus sp.]
MMTLTLTLNGRPREVAAPSRMSLADVLRETCGLTGTHLGCEHGVCGACTVLLDGQPARSCITLAAACGGAEVTTIEGLDDDVLADALRRAFSRHHALQCGYCTPGMLISARDLVLRMSEPDDKAIRVGLSGNLCRCTGYVGIVNAVKDVIAAQRDAGVTALPGGGRAALGPVGAHASAPMAIDGSPGERPVEISPALAAPVAFTPAHSFEHSFSLRASPERVFALFADVRAVSAAIPGLTLTKADDRHPEGAFAVGLGPVRAKFEGQADISQDPATYSGRILTAGGDAVWSSRARGVIDYRVRPQHEGGSAVDLQIGYSLTGLLGQLGRPALIEAVARGMIAKFAHNLERQLSDAPPERSRPLLARLSGVVSRWAARLGKAFR